MNIRFTVPGAPQGKARPRVMRTKSGQSRTYTPDKTVAYEELVRQRYLRAAGDSRFASDTALRIHISAFFGIPKSRTKKSKAAMASGTLRPMKTPDWDNIGKIVCDALNGLAYRDDAQIVCASVHKFYTEDDPYIRVELEEIGNPEACI